MNRLTVNATHRRRDSFLSLVSYRFSTVNADRDERNMTNRFSGSLDTCIDRFLLTDERIIVPGDLNGVGHMLV
jgi:hypothetical protein